ncbi:MAG: hypothetical protein LBO04_06300 [Spirochaetaceae bacterium]|jgi:hypothetical protein|nr:hypothetical protein [Spirochaetaceae bacterium]
MITFIDGSVADIKFESEKTIGDVLAGIERWADESGFCLSRVSVDGAEAETSDLDALFDAGIEDTETLVIETIPFATLYGEALGHLKKALASWQGAGKDRKLVEALWRESPAAAFLEDHDNVLVSALRGGFSVEAVKIVNDMINGRYAEAEQPLEVFFEMENELNEETRRLEDLPLDFQTGNDRRAAETIQGFSNFMQKMLRLFQLLKYAIPDKLDAGYSILFEEFKSALKEFLAAYQNKDMVLSGDLAEYEIAPRVKNIYTVLKEKLSPATGR